MRTDSTGALEAIDFGERFGESSFGIVGPLPVGFDALPLCFGEALGLLALRDEVIRHRAQARDEVVGFIEGRRAVKESEPLALQRKVEPEHGRREPSFLRNDTLIDMRRGAREAMAA